MRSHELERILKVLCSELDVQIDLEWGKAITAFFPSISVPFWRQNHFLTDEQDSAFIGLCLKMKQEDATAKMYCLLVDVSSNQHGWEAPGCPQNLFKVKTCTLYRASRHPFNAPLLLVHFFSESTKVRVARSVLGTDGHDVPWAYISSECLSHLHIRLPILGWP